MLKLFSIRLLAAGCVVFIAASAGSGAEQEDLFENRIRPVLAARCVTCHGADRQDGGIRLDTRNAIVKDQSKSGAVLAQAGDPGHSLLLQVIRGESSAPASCLLTPSESKAFAQWIESGLPWSEERAVAASKSNDNEAARNHWAFQPVREPAVPDVESPDWIQTPVDAFIWRHLQNANLAPSPQADRRTLIRRLSYTVTGLPPSPRDVQEFVDDPDPKAYEKRVESLLNSPQYGEHWARHWLDVARYSDTKGYIYAREERFWTHAWAYRDWVVRALNNDLPYDRFLMLQLAADQLVTDPNDGNLAAMGFLTLGRRFLGVERDIIDDRIDVVTRGTMGLTVGCARCHDHKYDPIPTTDYYSLYGVFASSRERLVSLGRPDIGGETFQAELKKRQEKLRTSMAKFRGETSARTRNRTADYLFAQTELEKYPANGFDQVFQKTDLLPAFAHRWADFLRNAKRRNDPVFVPWHAFIDLPAESFTKAAAQIKFSQNTVHPIVARAFQTPPQSMRDVADRYGDIFNQIDKQWQEALAAAKISKTDPPAKLTDPVAESLRRILYGPSAPCEVPDDPIVHSESYFPSGNLTALWKSEGDIYRWIIESKVEAPYALILEDRDMPVTPRVFIRGNPLKKGDDIPRQFLALLTGENREPFQTGSGRLEMARAIVAPTNPLTARVIVNRVWGHHFGSGLVDTPSDFGLRSNPPSHPELLDWLATQFVAEGWSLKQLHRWILLSSTFQQSSKGPTDPALRTRAVKADPVNRLLWRTNSKRLSWEQFRDSMFTASNELDLRPAGKPFKLLNRSSSKRRTLYGLIDRQFLPSLLRIFDFANPDLHIPRRSQTTVPQQALFFMNHPLVLERSRALAAFAEENASTPGEQVQILFQQVWQRNPTPSESAEALALIQTIGLTEQDLGPVTAADWQYGFGAFNEDSERVTDFTQLPHFTGDAWQGGEKWPDSKLGWVQLTAQGGHPGNNREHAAIRRWTAPHDMTLEIRSKLIHEPAPGDGIRAFIVSSRTGKLAVGSIHQQMIDLDVKSLQVDRGETIDFVVDIGKVLNSDQYLWTTNLFETPQGEQTVTWSSQSDFGKDQVIKLTAWEQLTQTLLCSNEFLFVD